MKKLRCNQVLAGIVGIIGILMLLLFGGGVTPPTLSAVAFIVIAGALWNQK